MVVNADVLIFAEDPGAANYVAPLPTSLTERGWHTIVLAAGIAKGYLLARGVNTEAVQPSATAVQILDRIRPRVLLVGTADNPGTLGLALVAAARSAGITSVGVVDAPMNAEYRFRGRSDAALTFAPDWLLVPDEWTKQAFVALGFPATQAVVCGHPHYDYVRETAARLAAEERNVLRQRVLPGVPANQKVVVFVVEGVEKLRPLLPEPLIHEYTLTGRGTSTGRTEILFEEFLDAIQAVTPRPYLVLRPHPKNTPDDYVAYLSGFDLVHTGGSPLELVYSADLVVGATSMLLLEAALLGRPTLSILLRADEKEWLPSIRTGVTPYVTTRAGLQSVLVDLLRAGSQPPPIDSHKIIVGGSLQRTVELIGGLLDESNRCPRTFWTVR